MSESEEYGESFAYFKLHCASMKYIASRNTSLLDVMEHG